MGKILNTKNGLILFAGTFFLNVFSYIFYFNDHGHNWVSRALAYLFLGSFVLLFYAALRERSLLVTEEQKIFLSQKSILEKILSSGIFWSAFILLAWLWAGFFINQVILMPPFAFFLWPEGIILFFGSIFNFKNVYFYYFPHILLILFSLGFPFLIRSFTHFSFKLSTIIKIVIFYLIFIFLIIFVGDYELICVLFSILAWKFFIVFLKHSKYISKKKLYIISTVLILIIVISLGGCSMQDYDYLLNGSW